MPEDQIPPPILLLITGIEEEARILDLALHQRGYFLVHLPHPVTSSMQCLAHGPRIILMEITQSYLLQCNTIQALAADKRGRNIPVLAYGRPGSAHVKQTVLQSGAKTFLTRPLRIADLMEELEKYAPCSPRASSDKEGQAQAGVSEEQELQFLLDGNVDPAEKLDRMVGRVGRLMAFPFTASAVTRVADDPLTGAKKLAEVIAQDQAVAATILKISNSVFFAGRGKSTGSLQDAVIRIGFAATRNIALSLSVLKLFDNRTNELGFSRSDLWYHSLACALIAEKMARDAGYQSPSEAFIAGLLHDFGVLLLDEFFEEVFARVMSQTVKGRPAVSCEMELLGFNHNDLVERLFEQWRIPNHLNFAIKYHFSFLELDREIDPVRGQLTRLLGAASLLAKAANLGRSCDQFLFPVRSDALRELKLRQSLGPDFLQDVYPALDRYCAMLNLEVRPVVVAKPPAGQEKVRLGLSNHVRQGFEPHIFYLSVRGYGLEPLPLENRGIPGDMDLFVCNLEKDAPLEKDPVLARLLASQRDGNLASKPLLIFTEDKEDVEQRIRSAARAEVLEKQLDARRIDASIDRLLSPLPVP